VACEALHETNLSSVDFDTSRLLLGLPFMLAGTRKITVAIEYAL
jgi:hypothetical protein